MNCMYIHAYPLQNASRQILIALLFYHIAITDARNNYIPYHAGKNQIIPLIIFFFKISPDDFLIWNDLLFVFN